MPRELSPKSVADRECLGNIAEIGNPRTRGRRNRDPDFGDLGNIAEIGNPHATTARVGISLTKISKKSAKNRISDILRSVPARNKDRHST